ncbi:DUF547 domain-containing protein [Flavobacteriaceae bacterium]|jgi:hypothetical protein|nr:DUF547 domain-containing protein [Flavobacteriaceae bacterium]MDB4024985.1 DUF547 domain-containing protein [Flavobacteriaceae bacterium]MDB4236639.1 DUF547 domain-containing protein [Flavobacteriaceae bacterium]MDB9781274.1 DUF547 domain-containing protein [Flavobacteriaceae bacterium]MDB9928046.1 DUF547 domain-containing protein [Flavobacteriaceae bacterium]
MTKISTFICMLSFVAIQAQTSIFDSLLQKNVDKTGRVDYQSLKNNETLLDNYLAYIQNNEPTKDWSSNKKKAFWINTYNAYTIKIILNNYPLKSIRDIKIDGKTAWKIPFVKVGQKRYTLDQIEHEILRKKFNDPRIHVGINCASVSCPRLWNFAFTEDNIAYSLDNLMKVFINDTTRNKISKNNVALSEIFNWFSKDFIKNGTIINYLNTYAAIKISEKASIKYLTYDWSLNKK